MSQGGPNSNTGSGASSIETLTGNSGGAVGPDGSFNIDILGQNVTGIDITGNPATNSLMVTGLAASTTQVGTIETATDAEAIAITATNRALVPSNLGPLFASPPPIGGTLANTAVFSELDVDNININGNTISSTDANGNILLVPNGSGVVAVPSNNLYVGSAAPSNPFNLSIEGSSAGLIGESIQNTLVNAAAGAVIEIITEVGANDPFIEYVINGMGGAQFSTGIDNSDSDRFKITTGTSPSAGTTAVSITTAGIVTLPAGPLDVPSGGTGLATITDHAVLIGSGTGAITPVGPVASTGALLSSNGVGADPGFTTATYPLVTTANEILYSSATNTVTGLASAANSVVLTDASGVPSLSTSLNGNFSFTSSTAAVVRVLTVSNTDGTNSASTARLQLTTGGASAGDPFIQHTVTGVTNWSLGIDNSDSDAYVIAASSALGTTNVMRATTAGEVTYPLQPAFLAGLATVVSNVTGDGTVYTIIYDTEIYDQNSDFNLGTSTFTAPVTGKYHFDLTCLLTGGSGISAGALKIVTTATTFQGTIYANVVSTGNGGNSYSIDVAMTAADTATFTINATDSGGKILDIVGTSAGEYRNFASGRLVC